VSIRQNDLIAMPHLSEDLEEGGWDEGWDPF